MTPSEPIDATERLRELAQECIESGDDGITGQVVAVIKEALEALKDAQAVLAFYAHPTGRDVDGDTISIPDFYRELEFGSAAEQVLPKIRAAIATGEGKDES